jgi:hypothetical protein
MALSKIPVGGISASLGITMADQWRLSSNISLSADTSILASSNWEQVDTDGFSNLGSSMSQSSGTWTFPSTGIYLIQWSPQIVDSSDAGTRAGGAIYTTTDNSSYDVATDNYNNIYRNNARAMVVCSFMFDVTNTSTHKVQLYGYSEQSANLFGNSTVNRTHVTFIRLGDT